MIKMFLSRVVYYREGSDADLEDSHDRNQPESEKFDVPEKPSDIKGVRSLGEVAESESPAFGEKNPVKLSDQPIRICKNGESVDLSSIKTVKDLQDASKEVRQMYFEWSGRNRKLASDLVEIQVKDEAEERRRKFQDVGLSNEKLERNNQKPEVSINPSKSWVVKRDSNVINKNGVACGVVFPEEPVKVLDEGRISIIDGAKYVRVTVTHGVRNKKITGYIRVRDIARPLFEAAGRPSPLSANPDDGVFYEKPDVNPHEVDTAPGEKRDFQGAPDVTAAPDKMPTVLRRQKFKEGVMTKGENLDVYGFSWKSKKRTSIYSPEGKILTSIKPEDKVKILLTEAKIVDLRKYAYVSVKKANGRKAVGYVRLVDIEKRKG